jgi:hypothetical protein
MKSSTLSWTLTTRKVNKKWGRCNLCTCASNKDRLYPYVCTCSVLVCGTGFSYLARETPATCNRDSCSCFTERSSRYPLRSFRRLFEKGYGPHWCWGQMHQLVPGEMPAQRCLSSSITDQWFRVWVTFFPSQTPCVIAIPRILNFRGLSEVGVYIYIYVYIYIHTYTHDPSHGTSTDSSKVASLSSLQNLACTKH